MPRPILVLLLLVLAAAAPPAAPPPLTREQAAAALSVLENPKTRDAFIATLRAIAEGAPASPAAAAGAAAPPHAPSAAAPAKPPPAPASGAPAKTATPSPLAIPLKPNGLGAQLLVDLSVGLSAARGMIAGAMRAMISFPLLSVWITSVWNDPYLHRQLFNVGWRLVLVIGAGLLAEWLAIRALASPRTALARLARRPRRNAEAEQPPPLRNPVDEGEARAEAGETEPASLHHAALAHLRRAGLAFLGFLLDLVPVLVFAAVANGLLASGLGEGTIVRLAIFAVANAYVVARILLSFMRMLMGAECAGLRLIPVSDAAALYAMLWARRIVAVSVFGYTATEVALLFGLYQSIHLALIKLVALVVHLLLAVIVWQQRRALAALIRAPEEARGPVANLRNLLAALWHWIAIFYLIALWVVWAIGIPNAFAVLLRFFAVTALVIVLAWTGNRAVWRAVERHIRIGEDLAERFPGLERRARHYLRGLRSLLASAVGLFALIVLLELWGVDSFAWFASGSLGGRVLNAAAAVGVTALAALLVWEAANSAIERHLARLSREGHVTRSARLRTLLPMLRTSLVIAIGVVVGLMVLSEIGVNIAPLLAGAGVIGIAIGFGSQKLVQDIINGLFLLFENAMQVGDVVSLGGLSGVVENLSIRTIRLRAADGSVHIIPFSAVTTITNQTRDYGFAVFNVGVAYKEDVDRVIEVLKEIARGMRKDPEWAPMIRDDLEVWGLDQFAASSVVIACRIRTGPSQRWSVLREFNRRMKHRFDELDIEMPFNTQKLVLDQPLSLHYLQEGRNAVESSAPGAVP
ncbi:MAG: mechanosensitive ion channel [Rhodospirillales bacterium]|nr:mechanosensitive ion channel [Rhodospirillales bacterium]